MIQSQKRGNKMKKTIDNIIFILGAILLIIVVTLKDNYYLMLLCIAIFFSAIGILLVLNKNKYWAIVLPIGLSLSTSILLYNSKKYNLSSSTIIFFLTSLLLIMLITIVKYYITLKRSVLIHNLEVEAEITDLIRNPNFDIDLYTPVLTYKIKGEIFEVNHIKTFSKNVPEIGSIVRIKVNPNDYYDVYFEPDKSTVIKNYVNSIFIIIFAIYCLLSVIL